MPNVAKTIKQSRLSCILLEFSHMRHPTTFSLELLKVRIRNEHNLSRVNLFACRARGLWSFECVQWGWKSVELKFDFGNVFERNFFASCSFKVFFKIFWLCRVEHIRKTSRWWVIFAKKIVIAKIFRWQSLKQTKHDLTC
jgi:hypothetical protein